MLISYSVAAAASPPLSGWCICVCGCLSFVQVETYFSASTTHRESGLRLVGIADQIQVLTQHLFLAVTVGLLLVWKIELSGMRVGEASPLCPESSQSDRYAPRFLNSASAPMSDISLGLPLWVPGRPNPCLDVLPRPSSLVLTSVDVFSPFFSRSSDRAWSWSFFYFPIVSTVAVWVVLVVCQVSSCFEHTVLAHACASSQNTGPHIGAHVAVCSRVLPLGFNGWSLVSTQCLLPLWLLFSIMIWSMLLQRFLRALVKSSVCLGTHDFAGPALGHGGWRDRRASRRTRVD